MLEVACHYALDTFKLSSAASTEDIGSWLEYLAVKVDVHV